MYGSEELSRIKRICLLYTKITLIMGFSSFFFIQSDVYNTGYWILFGLVACISGTILEMPLRCLLRNTVQSYYYISLSH